MHPSIAALLTLTPDVVAHVATCPDCRRLAGLADPPPRGRYERLGALHRGGMGRTVRAHDRVLGREVLLKELVAPTGLTAERLRARFEREARLTARLVHPAILPIYDLGADDAGTPFYAMPLVDGRTLTATVADTPTLAGRVLLVRHVASIAAAIAFAHDQRVVHRDIKPDNVLVGRFGQVVVIDWGLAAVLGEADAALGAAPDDGLTRFGVGTPAYMPPEQAEGVAADPRQDVYALGATLYHVLGGVPPYHDADAIDVRACLAAGPPTPLARLVPEAPPELITLVDRAMARDPHARFADAGGLASELERFVEGRLLTSHRYTRLDRVVRLVRNNRSLAATVALAGAVAVGVAGVSAWQVAAARDRAEVELERALSAESTLLAARPDRTADALVAGIKAFDVATAAGRAPARETVEALRIALRSGPTARRLPELHGWGPRGRAGGAAFATDGLATLWTLTAAGARGQPLPEGLPMFATATEDGRIALWGNEPTLALGRLGGDIREVALPFAATAGTFVGDGLLVGDEHQLAWLGADGRVRRAAASATLVTAIGHLGADGLVGDAEGVVRRLDRDGAELARWSVGHEAVITIHSGVDAAYVGTNDGTVARIAADGLHAVGRTDGPAEIVDVAPGCVLFAALDAPVTLAPTAPGGCAPRTWAADRGGHLSPDGSAVLIVDPERICTYDTATGSRRACAPTPPGTIGSGWIDAHTAFAIGFNGLVLWDAGVGPGHGIVGHDAEIVALAPIGQRVASAARDGSLRLQDPDTGSGIDLPPLAGGTSATAVSDDRLAAGSFTGEVTVVAATGAVSAPPMGDGIGALAFGPDGALAVGTFDGQLTLFDAGLRPTRTVRLSGGIRQLAWGATLVALGTDGRARRLGPDGAVVDEIGVEGTIGEVGVGADGTIWLRDRTGTFAWTPEAPRLVGRLVGVGPDGTIVTTTGDAMTRTFAPDGAPRTGWSAGAVIPRRVTASGFILGGEGAFWTLDGELAGQAPRPLTEAIVVGDWLVLGDVDGGLFAEPVGASQARARACQRLAVVGVRPEGC